MRYYNAQIILFLSFAAPSGAQQVINGSRTLLGNWDASSAATTKPLKAGTVIPASCGVGEMFFKTDAAAGANVYLCTGPNIWTQVQGGTGSGTVTNTGGALGVDLPLLGAGGNDAKTGTKTGAGNQVVVSQSPTIVSPVIMDFTNMPHSHANAAGGGQVGLSAILPSNISGNGGKLASVTGSLTSGNCTKFDATGNIIDSGSACGGPMTSVFGRNGAVTAQAGDYNFSQISGIATSTQLPAAIQYFSSGAGAPGGTCAAGQNTYLDNTNLDYWFCDAANTWKKVLSTTNSGPFSITGQTGTAPATPAAGFEVVYLSSTDKTLHTVNDAGTDMRYAGLSEGNAWGAFLQDFSASTIRLPVAAGFTTTTNGGIGYDSTANQLHAAVNSADAIIPTASTGAPTGGDCVRWGSNFQLQDSGTACGGSGGGVSVDGSGDNGVETVQSGSVAAITGSGTVRGAWPPNVQSGTSYTFVTGDRGKLLVFTNAAAVAVTLPQATSGAGTNFPNGWCAEIENQGSATDTITPTTSTVNGVATLALAPNQGAKICSDATNYRAVLYGFRPPLITTGVGYQPLLTNCDYCISVGGISVHDVKVWQFVAKQSELIKSINFLNGTNTASSFGTWGIYSDSSGACGTLLGQATPIAQSVAAATVLNAVMATPVYIVEGSTYWLAYTSDVTGGGFYGQGSASTSALAFNEPGHARGGTITNASTGTGGTLALATSCGTPSASGILALPLAVAFP